MPQAEQQHRQGIDIREQNADAPGVGGQGAFQRTSECVRAGQKPAVSERLALGVLEDDLFGMLAGGGHDGGQHVPRAEVHFHLEAVLDHPVAQPISQLQARLGGAEVFQFGWREDFTEMGGDGGEPFAPAGIRDTMAGDSPRADRR